MNVLPLDSMQIPSKIGNNVPRALVCNVNARSKEVVMSKRISLFAIAVISVALAAGCSMSGPQHVLDSYVSSHNEHEAEDAWEHFDIDARVFMDGVGILNGKREILPWSEWNATLNSLYTVNDAKVKGDTVRFVLKETNDWFKAVGIDTVTFDPCWMNMKNGKIVTFSAKMAADSYTALNDYDQKVIAWARDNEPDELGQVFDGDDFSFSKEHATTWLSIVHDYQAAKKAPDDTASAID